MARITVEDCLEKVDNRFALIHLAAKRVRHLRKGAEPLIVCKNKDIVVSLREIAASKVNQHREGDPEKIEAPDQALLAEETPEPEQEAVPEQSEADAQAQETEG